MMKSTEFHVLEKERLPFLAEVYLYYVFISTVLTEACLALYIIKCLLAEIENINLYILLSFYV